jgi:hypothetical protein
MTVQPRITRVATTWPGNFVVDDLVVPLVGGNAPDPATCSGTLKSELVTVTYLVNVITFTFAPSTLQAGVAVVPSLEVGTSNLLEVAVDSINVDAQTVGIRFRTAAGAAATPPSGAENAKLHLAIFRPLPVR